MKKNNSKRTEKYLFLGSLFFSLLIGLLLSYNFDFTNNYNFLFESDTARVIGDASNILYDHHRLLVHPLFTLLVQPLCLLLTGFTQNSIISLIIMSSLVTSTTTLFIYKILNEIKKDDKQNILISLIYLFSFSNIVYTAGIEIYNYASLFLVLLWYYYLKIKDNKYYDKYTCFYLILLGILSAGFTITNFIVYFIVLGLLFIDKKINIKKVIIISVITVVSLLSLNFLQHTIWKSAPLLLNKTIKEEKTYANYHNLSKTNIENVIKNDFYNSIVSSNPKVKVQEKYFYNNKNFILTFNNLPIINIIILSIFYLIILLLLIRNIKKNTLVNIGLLWTLLFNTCLHIIYGNNSTFLYSLHFLYQIILLLGINLLSEDNKKLKIHIIRFLIVFIIFEIIINTKNYISIIKLTEEILPKAFLCLKFGLPKAFVLEVLIVLLIGIFTFLIIKLFNINNIIKNRQKKKLFYIIIFSIVLLIQLFFIKLNSLKYEEKTSDKEKKDIVFFLKKDFKKYFKKEIKEYNLYKNEYYNFKEKYTPEINTFDEITTDEYYYFGFANRRKLLYKPGLLMDIYTKEVLYEFEEEERLIIPNIYTVLVKTTSNDYIKIYEDEFGVHYSINKKDSIVEKTDIQLDLYNFDNQDYQQIKKELYGEILFNIKDSTIYPNIIVYEKPWYRDAAITSMVLKQTNNTNLITEWINNITELYDKNNGYEEPDNLGELLYLISTQENRNEELIDRIEEEAQRLAEDNPNGYYLYGKTDFTDQHLYQNLWYKLGIEKVDREYHFDLEIIPEDDYSKGAWWSTYKTSVFNNLNSNYEYPYLSYAIRHKQKQGNIIISSQLYPLSWEKNASHAKYENYQGISNTMYDTNTSVLHTWSAAELLLFIMDETNDLDYDLI